MSTRSISSVRPFTCWAARLVDCGDWTIGRALPSGRAARRIGRAQAFRDRGIPGTIHFISMATTAKDELWIELDEPHRDYAAGDTVRGRVHLRAPSGVCNKVSLARCWRAHGRREPEEGGRLEMDLHEGTLPARAEHVFPFALPLTPGPFSYDGALLRIEHVITATFDRAFERDLHADTSVRVVPGHEPPPPPDMPFGVAAKSEHKNGSISAGCGVMVLVVAALLGWSLSMVVGVVVSLFSVGLFFEAARQALVAKKLGRVAAELGGDLRAPGDALPVSVTLSPEKPVEVNEVTATLICRELLAAENSKSNPQVQELHRQRVVLHAGGRVPGGEPTALRATLRIPEKPLYSFFANTLDLQWLVELHVDIKGWPDWEDTLHFRVWPSGPNAPVPPRAGASAATAERAADPAAPAPNPAAAAGQDAAPARAADDAAALIAGARAVLHEARAGEERQQRVQALLGRDYRFALVIARVESSSVASARYRDGRTITGTVADSEVAVRVRFPASRNAELDALAPGATLALAARSVTWESFADVLLLEA